MAPDSCCGECAPNIAAHSPKGWIALISRGNCSFVQKILNAQTAGAAGVVVSNNQGHDQLVIMGGDSRRIKIPSVFVSQDSGQILRELVHSSVTDSNESTTGLEVELSPCGMDSNYYAREGNMFLPDYLLLLLVCATMLCSMCTVGLIRWRLQLLYPNSPPPVEQQVVIDLPQRTCTEAEDGECIICLESFQVDDVVRILPCRHEYHSQCIDKWLTSHHRTCPICKGDITTMQADGTAPESEPGWRLHLPEFVQWQLPHMYTLQAREPSTETEMLALGDAREGEEQDDARES